MTSSNFDRNFDRNFNVLHSKFDFDTHNSTFINYCEVVILEDGTIEYAVPSHEQKLIKVFCDKFNMPYDVFIQKMSRDEVNSYYFEICSYLAKCMLVDTYGCRFAFIPNKKQDNALRELVRHGCLNECVLTTYDTNVRANKQMMSNDYWKTIISPIIEHFLD